MSSEQELRAAKERGDRFAREVPKGVEVSFDVVRRRVWVKLTNGLELAIAPELYSLLQDASAEQMSAIELCAAGHELYFPLLDEGIWLPNLYRRMFGITHYDEIVFGAAEEAHVSPSPRRIRLLRRICRECRTYCESIISPQLNLFP